MAFKQVPNKVDFIEQEHEILAFWKETDAFEKSRELRKGKPTWSFIDGPITANTQWVCIMAGAVLTKTSTTAI